MPYPNNVECRVCGEEIDSLNDHIEDRPDCREEYTMSCPACGDRYRSLANHWKQDGDDCRRKIAEALDERARRRRQGQLDNSPPDHVAVAGQ